VHVLLVVFAHHCTRWYDRRGFWTMCWGRQRSYFAGWYGNPDYLSSNDHIVCSYTLECFESWAKIVQCPRRRGN
jgi:hypothetical protein